MDFEKMWLKMWLWCMRHFIALLFLGILIPVGLIGVARFDSQSIAIAIFWAGAMLAVGFLFGLLFALPRYSRAETRSGNNDVNRALDVNTNLLEIADWLTKIIVGLGLIELKGIPSLLHNFSAYVAAGFHPKGSEQFAMAMILYFLVLGFLCGYLLTRLELNRLIRAADVIYTTPFSEKIESLSEGELPDPTTERPKEDR